MSTDLPNIAFIGKAGAGKDTAGALLIEHFGYRRLSFADKLREVAVDLWGEEARNDRDKLQGLGVTVRKIEPDTWVNAALAKLTTDVDGTERICVAPTVQVDEAGTTTVAPATWHPVVVTDLRFPNEAEALTAAGFVTVRIESDRTRRIRRLEANGKLGLGDWETHESETALDSWPEQYRVTNDADLPSLFAELVRVITTFRGAWS